MSGFDPAEFAPPAPKPNTSEMDQATGHELLASLLHTASALQRQQLAVDRSIAEASAKHEAAQAKFFHHAEKLNLDLTNHQAELTKAVFEMTNGLAERDVTALKALKSFDRATGKMADDVMARIEPRMAGLEQALAAIQKSVKREATWFRLNTLAYLVGVMLALGAFVMLLGGIIRWANQPRIEYQALTCTNPKNMKTCRVIPLPSP